MKINQLINLSLIFFILTQTANSQDLLATSAANAFVSRASSNNKTAQITYKDKIEKPTSTLGDVQYVYEIHRLNLKENNNNFNAKLFSNETSSYLLLEIDNYENENLSYQISDL